MDLVVTRPKRLLEIQPGRIFGRGDPFRTLLKNCDQTHINATGCDFPEINRGVVTSGYKEAGSLAFFKRLPETLSAMVPASNCLKLPPAIKLSCGAGGYMPVTRVLRPEKFSKATPLYTGRTCDWTLLSAIKSIDANLIPLVTSPQKSCNRLRLVALPARVRDWS